MDNVKQISSGRVYLVNFEQDPLLDIIGQLVGASALLYKLLVLRKLEV
jgi:hypothetical protein